MVEQEAHERHGPREHGAGERIAVVRVDVRPRAQERTRVQQTQKRERLGARRAQVPEEPSGELWLVRGDRRAVRAREDRVQDRWSAEGETKGVGHDGVRGGGGEVPRYEVVGMYGGRG